MVNDIGSNDIAHVHVRLCEESERRAEFCKRSAVGWAGWRRAQQKGSVNGSTDTLTLFNNFPLLLIYTHLSTRFISSTKHDSPRTCIVVLESVGTEVTMWPYRVANLRVIELLVAQLVISKNNLKGVEMDIRGKFTIESILIRSIANSEKHRCSSPLKILDKLYLRMENIPSSSWYHFHTFIYLAASLAIQTTVTLASNPASLDEKWIQFFLPAPPDPKNSFSP